MSLHRIGASLAITIWESAQGSPKRCFAGNDVRQIVRDAESWMRSFDPRNHVNVVVDTMDETLRTRLWVYLDQLATENRLCTLEFLKAGLITQSD